MKHLAKSLMGLICTTGLVFGCGGGEGTGDGGPDSGDGRYCQHDDLLGPGSAGDLEGAEGGELTATGYVCPTRDTDWYRLNVPNGHHLLRVDLSITGPGSPVQPTYAVYECDEACVSDSIDEEQASCCTARVAPRPDEVSDSVSVTHCIEPGDYYIAIRDLGDDAQDDREPRGVYNLSLSTVPDADDTEPNDGPESAAAFTSAGSRAGTATGQIACRGDQDWYVLDGSSGLTVNDGDLLSIRLEAPVAMMHFKYTVYRMEDGERIQVATQSNPAGTVEATNMEEITLLASGGIYYVAIEDDDGGEADPGASYILNVVLTDDRLDPNEPNNAPEDATSLGTHSCGDSWDTTTNHGAISATNDVDIFRIGLDAGCAGQILEAEVVFAGTPPEGLEPSIRLVRAHPETPCDDATDCTTINIECDTEDPAGLNCGGFGNSCRSDGLCSGASMCLPGGVCGAYVLERHPDFCGADGHCHGPTGAMRNRECSIDTDCDPQDRIATAIPIGRNPDATSSAIDQVFLVISDFGSDVADATLRYDVTVRTRRDPDGNEPNEFYNPLLNDDTGVEAEGLATPATWGGCISGRLSYERDQDVFTIPHPCPGTGGCTLHMTYAVDSGPVEVLAYVRGAWDNLAELDPEVDPANNGALSGDRGGSGECMPANDNLRDNLTIVVRDLDLQRDFSADQNYRFCFDAPSAGCSSPCVVEAGQCWYPPDE